MAKRNGSWKPEGQVNFDPTPPDIESMEEVPPDTELEKKDKKPFVRLSGIVIGHKDALTMDLRAIRKEIIAVFHRLGGAEQLAQWAAETRGNYRDYIFNILIPMLPKFVDEDGISQDPGSGRGGSGRQALVFNREDFKRYLDETGQGERGSTGDQEKPAGAAG